jgi:hypothetical protein
MANGLDRAEVVAGVIENRIDTQMEKIMLQKINTLMDEFSKAIERLSENVKQCAEIYTKAVIINADSRTEFPKKFPFLPNDMWASLEKVGRGMMDSRLLFHHPRVFRALQTLPLQLQDKYLTEGVDYLTHDGDCLIIKLENIGPNEKKEIFAEDHIRDLGEQRLYRERMTNRRNIKRPLESFEVKGGMLYVYQEARFSIDDIKRILSEAKRSVKK